MQDIPVNSQLSTLNKEIGLQNPNNVTFAKNAIKQSHEGSLPFYQSEPGNTSVVDLNEGELTGITPIGYINGDNDEIYILATDKDSPGVSVIGVYKNGFYQSIVYANLGFNTKYPITGEFRIKNGCERIIYWCDGNNPDYWFNFDKPEDFETGGVWDVNKFKFVPNVQVPKIDLVQVNDSGGILPLGSYYFQLELLDKGLNSIYKTDISPQTIIYDDSQSGAYNLIDGGLNYPQFDPAVGGVPPTNKSITLKFSNLDTSFQYLRLNVARNITSNNVTDAHAVGQLIPISSSTVYYTYKGYNTSEGDYALDYSEMLIDNIRYESAYVMEQVQGRLLRANLKQSVRDYSAYQSYASSTRLKWVSRRVEAKDASAIGNAKNPLTYWYGTGFQGDEVYAFGIQYLHEDGTWSPVFHIPGKPPIASDRTLLTVIATGGTPTSTQVEEREVEHLDQSYFTTWNTGYIGSTIEKWKVFNTATIDSSPNTDDIWQEGDFSFYETDTTYPNIRDCDDNLIWSEDQVGNPITTSTKIRHYKFPDRRLVNHYDGDYIYPIGIKVDSIGLPNNTIGYRICQVERNEFNKTVLDSGISFASNISGQWNFFHDQHLLNNTKVLHFHSPYVQFKNKIFNNSFISNQKVQKYDTSLSSPSVVTYPLNTTPSTDINTYIDNINDIFNSFDTPDFINYKVTDQCLIEPTKSTLYLNPSTNSYITVNNNLSSVSINLISITVDADIAANYLSSSTSDSPCYFYTYKKSLNISNSNVLSLIYKPLFHDSDIIFNGDTLIHNMSIPYISNYLGTISGTANAIGCNVHNNCYYESDINVSMRYSGTTPNFTYFDNSDKDIWIRDKWIVKLDNMLYDWKSSKYPEFYGNNIDYNSYNKSSIKSPLPLQYDYCSNCLNSYPNKIVFSPVSFDDESFDLYRITKANDDTNIPAHRGSITGLKYRNNQLLIHTEDSTFLMQPNPQAISTDQNTAYLTTGDFLSIPPQELIQTDLGFAGCQTKQHYCSTPYGHVWVDQKRGKIFMFDDKLSVLSNSGLNSWFMENLKSEMQNKYYSVNQTDYPQTSTYHSTGIGLLLYFDPRFNRLLLTKKDYLPLTLSSTERDDSLYYDALNDLWKYDSPSSGVIFGNSNQFENKSWTISYSFDNQGWVSWHDYIPIFAMSDNNNFYTLKDSMIYKHLYKSNYQNYYGTKYDFVVEWSMFDPTTSVFDNVYYYGHTFSWDDNLKQWIEIPDVTFDRFMLYTPNQSTGLQTLSYQNQNTNPYGNNSITGSSKYVIRTDDNYKISGIYDMSTGRPVITKDWTTIKTYPGYNDIAPYNINLTKSFYDWGNISDKIASCRLYFKPNQDYKKIVYFQTNNNKPSVR